MYYLECERTEEASYFDKLRGAQEIADFCDKENGRNTNASEKDDNNVQNVQRSPNVSIHSTLNPTKPLTLHVSRGNLHKRILNVL